MLYCGTAWQNSLSVKDKVKMYHIKICSKTIGLPVAHLIQEAHKSMFRLARYISTDVSHVLYREHQLLPLGALEFLLSNATDLNTLLYINPFVKPTTLRSSAILIS